MYFRASYYAPLTYRWFFTDGVNVTDIPDSNTWSWPGPGPAPLPLPNPDLFTDSITIGRRRYYAFDDGTHGTELWVSEGRQARLVADLNPGKASSLPDDLALVNGRLVFAATTQDAGRELFVLNVNNDLRSNIDGRFSSPDSQPLARVDDRAADAASEI